MNKRFPFMLPKVSDALNGVIALGKQAAVFNPFTYRKKGVKGNAILALGIVCFFWGTTWVASKEGVRHMPALQLAGLRQTLGGVFYVVYFLSRRAPFPKGKEWWPILVLSFLNFMLSNGLSTWGVQYISAGLGSIIGAIFPLWLVLIALFGSHSQVNKKAALGLVCGFSGICLIFYQHLHDFLNPGFQLGILLSFISTWSWAFGTLYTKKQAGKFNPYFSLGLQMVISGCTLYFISFATHNTIAFTEIPWQSWTAIAYLVVFGSVLSFIAYLYALQNLPTEQVSLYAYINPVVALLTGAIVFGEKLTVIIGAGVIVTLYGVRLVHQAARP
jgi:drug/metabolite transporter (DMT)-like permease